MNLTYTFTMVAGLTLTGLANTAEAQSHAFASTQTQTTPAAATATAATHKMETLSGIHLQPTKQGTYELDFSQELKEDAVLEIMNNAGKVVFQQPLHMADSTTNWHFDVGTLRTDNYQVAIRTSDTTYWSKFKVRNPKPVQASKKRK